MKKASYVDQLDELLTENIQSVQSRQKNTVVELTDSFKILIVLFGAGNLGRKLLAGLRSLGIQPVVFADNNSALWGKSVDGLVVFSPEEAARKYGTSAVFVIAIWNPAKEALFRSINQQLVNLKCSRIISFAPIFWKYPEIFLPHPAFDLPCQVYDQSDEVKFAMQLLSDSLSRHEFLAQIQIQTHLDYSSLPPLCQEEQYFSDDLFSLTSNEFFVDCGAFDGDTIRYFLKGQPGFTGKILALEPDPENYKRLNEYIKTLDKDIQQSILTMPVAVSAQREKVKFSATGTISAMISEEGEYEVDCIPLDDLLAGNAPTYIKMDIEGAELDALKGARQSISKHLPVLAICVYHLPEHLWKIPSYIHSLSPRYHLFLRRYLGDKWEIVCYAVPDFRLNTKLPHDE